MDASYNKTHVILALLRLKATDDEHVLRRLTWKAIFEIWQSAPDVFFIDEILLLLPRHTQDKFLRLLTRAGAEYADARAWNHLERAMQVVLQNPDYHYYVTRSRLFREDILRACGDGMAGEIIPYERMVANRADWVYFNLIEERLILEPKPLDNLTLNYALLRSRERGEEKPGHQPLCVWFGTNRAAQPSAKGTEFLAIRNDLANPAGELIVGRSVISVPLSHVYGKLERPAPWWKVWKGNTEDVNDHFVIHTVEKMAQKEWLESAGEQYPEKEGLLFIHGYSNTFDDALFKTAQLKVDLKFKGIALCFSWASCGVPQDYMVDESTIEWSRLHLQQFIDLIINKLGLTRLHIVAHSMGNRALLEVIKNWQPAEDYNPIRTLVLAAPDIDTGTLAQLEPYFAHYPAVTLYASTKDVAINISHSVHRYARAGNPRPPLILKHMETVDVSATNTELFSIGHAYYAHSRAVFNDMYYLIRNGLKADDRAGIMRIESENYFTLI
ncbi:alpha/beta hydrolase [Enterobacter sp.]|uniref:alpha/beta hydrolase n=1 Tax=Enterobacter sp. TaxID=42895 RepID=UPI00296E7161|nr:alpha/beta hydrolase [Enterobacter sp.]